MSDCQIIGPNGYLTCEWCGVTFTNRSHFGRVPRFCRASHRVRACERRRGLLRPKQPPVRTQFPAPGRQGPIGTAEYPWLRLQHELGESPYLRIADNRPFRYHRLRIGGLPNMKGYVPSLCGALVRPSHVPAQAVGPKHACIRCEGLSKLHPVDPNWWDATTQRTATTLLNDLQSTILALGQAGASKRDPQTTIGRVEQELRHFAAALGLPPAPQPSLHPRSTK